MYSEFVDDVINTHQARIVPKSSKLMRWES